MRALWLNVEAKNCIVCVKHINPLGKVTSTDMKFATYSKLSIPSFFLLSLT